MDELNKLLKPRGVRLDLAYTLLPPFFRFPQIKLANIDPTKRRVKQILTPSFCPFCGKKYARLDYLPKTG